MAIRRVLLGLSLPTLGLLLTPTAAWAGTRANPSTNFAGYVASVSNGSTTLSGTISIPTVTCPATGDTTLSPEIAVGTTNNFILFESSINCANGTQSNSGFTAGIYPSGGGIALADGFVLTGPGDVVKFSLAINSKGVGTVKVSDAKKGTSGSGSAPVAGSITSVQAGTFVFSAAPTLVPMFTPIHYGSITIGLSALSQYVPAEYEIYNASTLQVKTSALSQGTFQTTFVHS